MAAFLGAAFVDPADCVCFTSEGELDEERTQETLRNTLLPCERAVIAGFYGRTPDGAIKTFSRGGSDVTGALVARAIRSGLSPAGASPSSSRIRTGRKIPAP